jgi:GDP-L-fucose synthase
LLYSDDAAEACLFLLELEDARYDALLNEESAPLVNIGTGEDVTIRELAGIVARVTGFEGELVFDTSKPDGTPRKLLDVQRIHALGWTPNVGLEEGIRRTYDLVREGLDG